MKIVEYSIENAGDVQTSIDHGYVPYGNPLVWDGQVVQAMVKYEQSMVNLTPYPKSKTLGKKLQEETDHAQ